MLARTTPLLLRNYESCTAAAEAGGSTATAAVEGLSSSLAAAAVAVAVAVGLTGGGDRQEQQHSNIHRSSGEAGSRQDQLAAAALDGNGRDEEQTRKL